jgi:septum formation topological specificity factor MinE
MKVPALILITALAILPVAPATAQERANPPTKEQADASSQKIKELRKERITILKKQVEILNELVRLPRARGDSFGEAFEATLLLVQAELDVTERGADRTALYKQASDRLKRYEDVAKADVAAGRNTEAAVLRIKARRLEIETTILSGAPISPQDKKNPPVKEQGDASAQKIKELRKERIATLKKLVDQVASDFKSTKGSYEKVLDAQLLLLQAELDAAEKEAERIALYGKVIDVLKKHEELAKAYLAQGRAPNSDVLRAKARRLEFEILLEQAKAKEAKEGK